MFDELRKGAMDHERRITYGLFIGLSRQRAEQVVKQVYDEYSTTPYYPKDDTVFYAALRNAAATDEHAK